MNVGFIGLGNMGREMALNLCRNGYTLAVNDLRPDAGQLLVAAGAKWCASARAVARDCDVLLTSLPGPAEVEALAFDSDGIADVMREGTVWFDLSTNAPDAVRRLHERLEQRGIAFLDAPVSGGVQGARDATLGIWVGGEREHYDQHYALLAAMGEGATFTGPIGAGTVTKLVHNCVTFMVQTAVIEAYSVGVKAGVEPAALWESVCKGSNGKRRIFDFIPRCVKSSHEDVSFALALAHKDVTLATQLGKAVGVPMRLANLTCEELTEAMGRGWGEQNASVAARVQLERASLDIALSHEEVEAVRKRQSNLC